MPVCLLLLNVISVLKVINYCLDCFFEFLARDFKINIRSLVNQGLRVSRFAEGIDPSWVIRRHIPWDVVKDYIRP